MTSVIITIFIIGYLFIALESLVKVNKAGIAMLMGILCWILLIAGSGEYVNYVLSVFENAGLCSDKLRELATTYAPEFFGTSVFAHYLAEVCETVLFLMGAMTVVETVDSYGGFSFVKSALYSENPRAVLWKVVGLTFILSATLDNMTTSIVMVTVLQSIIKDKNMRMKFAGIVILAANAGGAFSPIGDVTTIMLWIHKNVSTLGIITGIFMPSLINIVIPALIIMLTLKGKLEAPEITKVSDDELAVSPILKRTILIVGVGGLISVPFFHTFTNLPPFMGVFCVMSLLWIITEVFLNLHHGEDPAYEKLRVPHMISKIDMSTIFFFIGILLAVDAISATGSLKALGVWLDENVGNIYLVDSIIGVASSVIDNVPLVASAMGMYPIADAAMVAADPNMANYVQDGLFWELLAYCAGTGGSILIIGSAAGVVTMGIEKISFIWYLKHFSWLAIIGYAAGVVWYWFEKTVLVGLL